MNMEFVKDYKDDVRLRYSFNELAGLVFGADFEKWYQTGFWNDRYICYSYTDDGKVVANVSANIIDLIIDAERIPALQIGTVMTHPDYRKRGLAEELMKKVLADYSNICDVIFLFANPDAQGFYKKFRFDTANETCFYTKPSDIRPTTPAGSNTMSDSRHTSSVVGTNIRKLSMSSKNDIEILRRLSHQRVPLSNSFDTANTEGILQWHCLNSFPEDLYYFESLDAIVIFGVNGKQLDVYDIICTSKPNYQQILGAMNIEGIEEIIFHFTPETDEIKISRRPYATKDYIFYVMSKSVKLNGEFFYHEKAHA